MKKIRITSTLSLAGLSMFLTGCQCLFFDKQQEMTAIVVDNRPKVVIGPVGNFGTLNIIPGTDLNPNLSTTGCFPASAGWDKYYATGWFLGPGATANPNNFPNTGTPQSTAINISTVDDANGATLDTGILINYEFNPNDKVCNDNVGTGTNPKLSSATKTLDNNKRYRVTVFFKSTTIGNLANIKVNWRYQ